MSFWVITHTMAITPQSLMSIKNEKKKASMHRAVIERNVHKDNGDTHKFS